MVAQRVALELLPNAKVLSVNSISWSDRLCRRGVPCKNSRDSFAEGECYFRANRSYKEIALTRLEEY